MLIRAPIIRLMTFPFGEGGSRSETDEVPIIRLMTFPFGEVARKARRMRFLYNVYFVSYPHFQLTCQV